MDTRSTKDFSESGFRSVNPDVAKDFDNKFKQTEGLFDTNYLGGWKKAGNDLYGDGGNWDQVVAGK